MIKFLKYHLKKILYKYNFKLNKIYIQNEDQISINYIEKQSVVTFARVGVDGNIILPEIGKINVNGRKLSEVNKMISANLIKKDFTPTFQLEITEFNSKKI